MKIIVTSDTHNHYSSAMLTDLPDGDMLIHCGDYGLNGRMYETDWACEWFRIFGSKFKYKIIIPGNHDFYCEEEPNKAREMFAKVGATLLINEGIEIEGIKIWGSPHTPKYGNFAFMLDSVESREAIWSKIPTDTDILITHGPPLYLLDRDGRADEHLGCPILKKYVDIIKPKYHFFGHLHKGYGKVDYYGNTTFVNASFCNVFNIPTNPPIIINY